MSLITVEERNLEEGTAPLQENRSCIWWALRLLLLGVGVEFVGLIPCVYAFAEPNFDFAFTMYCFAGVQTALMVAYWWVASFTSRLENYIPSSLAVAANVILLVSSVEITLALLALGECVEQLDESRRKLCVHHFELGLVGGLMPLWGWLVAFQLMSNTNKK